MAKEKVKITCQSCSDSMLVYPSKSNKKYCSLECRNNSYKNKPSWNKGLRKKDHPSISKMGFQKGEDNPMWKGGDSDRERRNSEYRHWRLEVFKRDKFICQKCGYYNGCGEKRRDLNAHHIVPWIESIELRYEVDNGITFCVPCHIKEHTDKN